VEHIASIFRVEEEAEQETGMKEGPCCTLHNHRCENLKSYIAELLEAVFSMLSVPTLSKKNVLDSSDIYGLGI
jgi:hypothetical protein